MLIKRFTERLLERRAEHLLAHGRRRKPARGQRPPVAPALQIAYFSCCHNYSCYCGSYQRLGDINA